MITVNLSKLGLGHSRGTNTHYELKEWCHTNLGQPGKTWYYYYLWDHYTFDKEEDALAFKLKFGL